MGLFKDILPGVVPDIVQGASGIIGNIMQRKTNKQLAEYAYTKDLEMWNRANEYNSPENQMQRLKDAGLNPNLAYGSGNVAGNTSTQTPKYQMPEQKYEPVQMPNVLGMLGQYQDIQQKKAITDNLTEQFKGIVQDNANKLKDGFLKDVQLQWLQSSMPGKLKNLELTSQSLDVGNELRRRQSTKTSLENVRLMGTQGQYFERYGLENKGIDLKNKLADQALKNNVVFNTLRNQDIGLGNSLQRQQILQNSRMNELDYQLLKNRRKLSDLGLDKNSNVFLDMIGMQPDLSEWGAMFGPELMKFYLLQQGGSFVRDLSKIGVGAWGAGKLFGGKNTLNTTYTDQFDKRGNLKGSSVTKRYYEKP